MLGFQDPLSAPQDQSLTFGNFLEIIFFIFYLIEMTVKIVALGFLFNRGAYLRDPWNMLDFLIVTASVISLIQTYSNPSVPNSNNINFSSLRTIRILRPLRTINAVKKLRTLVETILNSIPYLLDIFLIILLSMVIFSISAMQLFPGDFLQQCFHASTGRRAASYSIDMACGGIKSCSAGFICGKISTNPVSGIFSFDSFPEAYLTIFVIITTEGWSLLNQYLIYASSWFSVAFCSSIIFIETWFLHNLLLAIISAKFNEAQDKQADQEIEFRNHSRDKIFNRYFKPMVIRGYSITSVEGVPLAKMLMYNPDRYTQRSAIHSLKCGHNPSGIFDYLLRPFYTLRDEIHQESMHGLTFHLKRIKQAEYLDLEDEMFFTRRRKEFEDLRSRISVASGKTSIKSDPTDKLVQKISGGAIESEYEEICDAAALNPDKMAKDNPQLRLLFEAFENHNIPKPAQSLREIQLEQISSSRKEENTSQRSLTPAKGFEFSWKRSTVAPKPTTQALPQATKPVEEAAAGEENISDEDLNEPATKLADVGNIQLQVRPPTRHLHQGGGSIEMINSHHSSSRMGGSMKDLKIDQIFKFFEEEEEAAELKPEGLESAGFVETPTPKKSHSKSNNIELFQDRFNTDWLEYTYWENVAEYNYQSYNHFAGLKNRVKMKSARKKKTAREIMDIADFDDQERSYRDYLETLPLKHVNRDACLRYKYDPEACFNSMVDVLQPNKTKEPVLAPAAKPASKIPKQKYTARAYSPKDSLWQPGEFVTKRKPRQILEFDNSNELSRGQMRRLYRQRWYKQTSIMKKKPFFPLNRRNDTLAMIERADFNAGKYDRRLQAKQLQRQQDIQLRLESQANEEQSNPQISDEDRLFKMHTIRSSGSGNLPGISAKFLNDFIEVDAKHILEADDSEEEFDDRLKKVLNETKLENHELFNALQQRDQTAEKIASLNWSGEQVCHHLDYRKGKTDKVLSSLNNQDLLIWLQGWSGLIRVTRKHLERFIFSKAVDRFITFCILLNTVILTLDGLISNETADLFDKINTGLTFVFLVETIVKIAALGFKRFFSNMTYLFELAVTIISVVELSFILRVSSASTQANALSGFRSLRILRMFRVLRVARILQGLKFMKVIVAVIVESAEQYAYVGLIMLLFIFIYALLGMQIYAGNLKYQGQIPRMNFDSLLWSFVALFQLLTIENWTDILQTLYSSSVNKGISLLFVISWIIIGNYIFFNLFLALLLGGFDSDEVIKQLEEDQDEFKELEELIVTQKQLHLTKETDAAERAKKSNQRLQMMIRGGNYDLTNDDEVVLNALDEEEVRHRAQYLLGRSYVDDGTSEDDLLVAYLEEQLKEKREEEEVRENRIYAGVTCSTSLNLMTKSNPIRLFAAKIASHPIFESLVLFLIMVSTIKLVVETYLDDEGTAQQNDILGWIDFVITFMFGTEALLKIIRNGFFWDAGSYLRDPWSGLDFFIVVTSFIDLALTNVNLPMIKVFRTLRPLRFVRRYENMRVIISSLVGVLGPLVSVVLVILLVWLIFAILAMNFVGSKLYYCDITNFYGVSKTECLLMGATWKRSYWNFDNIVESFVTLFVLTSLEGWPTVMGSSLDASDNDGGPPIYNNYKWMLLYYLFFILGSSLFLLDLFTGVIFYQYGVELEKESNANSNSCTHEQIKWIMVQKLIRDAKPEYDVQKTPTNPIRKFCFNLVISSVFEIVMMAVIVLNIIIMCLYYEGMSKTYQDNLERLNQIISWIFVGEFLLKYIAFYWSYFADSWNIFDFLIVILGFVDFGLDLAKLNTAEFGWAPQVAKGFRAMRVIRITKLLKNDQLAGIKKLLKTLSFSLPSILNVFALLLMTYFIFAVIACFLFRNVNLTTTGNNNDVWNFQNFHSSLFMLFRCSTGEDWPTVMYNYGDANGLYVASRVFFIIFTIMTTFVILNLVDLVVVQIFENFYFDPDNALETFERVKQEFNPAWNTFTHRSKGKSIHYFQLLRFFAHLE